MQPNNLERSRVTTVGRVQPTGKFDHQGLVKFLAGRQESNGSSNSERIITFLISGRSGTA